MDKLNKLHYQLLQRPIIGAVIISSFYFFGTFGILLGYGDWFVPKTAFNLLLSFVILICYQQELNYKLVFALFACYLIGFTAEYLGVAYGLIFGNYYYPDTLGPQFLGVPIIIGINWFIITFPVWSILAKWALNSWIKILLAAAATTFIDVLIEPVAISLDFWTWQGGDIPIQNYVGWYVISIIIFTIYSIIDVPKENKMSIVLLAWQLFFFIVLNIFLQ